MLFAGGPLFAQRSARDGAELDCAHGLALRLVSTHVQHAAMPCQTASRRCLPACSGAMPAWMPWLPFTSRTLPRAPPVSRCWLCAWLYAMSRAACSATSAQTSCSARAQGCPAQLPDPILSGTEQRRLGRSCAAQPRTVAPRRSCACSCSSPAALQLLLWGRHACCSCRNALVSAMQPRCEARHASLTHPHARWACTSRMHHVAAD